jgi:RNA polymerase sigma-70 factor, ECF subfamily
MRTDMAQARSFCEREYGPLAGYCLAVSGDEQAARDITQEAFVRVLARWPELSKPRPYLYVTATNLVRRGWRQRDAERRAVSLLSSSYQASDQCESINERIWAQDIVAALPRRLSMVVLLHYFSDLSIDDIAKAMHLPPGTVKRRLHEARSELRVRLGSDADTT